MSFPIVRLAVITTALFVAVSVSAAPAEHELDSRGLATVISQCTQPNTVAFTYVEPFFAVTCWI